MLEQFSDRYVVKRDEVGDLIIPIRDNGHAYEVGPDKLGAYIQTRRPTLRFNTLKQMWPGLVLMQHGDREITVALAIPDQRTGRRFLASLGARSRRKLAPEAKAKLVAAGKAHRFRGRHGAGRPCSPPESPI